MIDLKSCPFCGKPGEIYSIGWVSCEETCVCLPIELWNTRPIEDDLKLELEMANTHISSQEKLIESIEEHIGVDDRGNSIWVQSSNNFIRKPCCSCGDDPCTCPF